MMNAEHFIAPLVLTDSPAVVQLKAEFRRLDAEAERLKAPCRAEFGAEVNAWQREQVQARKEEIARHIFFLSRSVAAPDDAVERGGCVAAEHASGAGM